MKKQLLSQTISLKREYPNVLKKLFFLLAWVTLFLPLSSLGQIKFQIVINSVGAGRSVKQTTDKGFIIATSTGYLIKTDSTGAIQWSYSYAAGVQYFCVLQTSDGGYVAGGSSALNGSPPSLTKVDGNGLLMWKKRYGFHNNNGNASGRIYSVHEMANGDLMGSGYGMIMALPYTYSFRTTSAGVTVWESFGNKGSQMNAGYGGVLTPGGGYLAASFGTVGAEVDLQLDSIGSTGTRNSTALYSDGIGNRPGGFDFALDGGLIISGGDITTNELILFKTQPDGTPQWGKTYVGTNPPSTFYTRRVSVKHTADGGYIIVGVTKNLGAGGNDVLLIKTDNNGDVVWAKTYGGAGDDADVLGGASVEQTSDGGYIVTAATSTLGGGGVYLIKTDANGISGCNEQSQTITSTNRPFTSSRGVLTSFNYSIDFDEPYAQTCSGSETILCTTGGGGGNGCPVTLPIELLFFKGVNQGATNVLEWTTAIEIDNDYFTIEASADGLSFDAVGTVKGAGNSTQTLNYSLIDEHPYQHTYYRLKQTDFNGDGTYSQTILIALSSIDIMYLNSNLVSNEIECAMNSSVDTDAKLIITDMLGRQVKSETLKVNSGYNQLMMNVADLSKGSYILQVIANKGLYQAQKQFSVK